MNIYDTTASLTLHRILSSQKQVSGFKAAANKTIPVCLHQPIWKFEMVNFRCNRGR